MSQTADAIDVVDVPTLLRFINYPDSDGKPMADNTKQYQYIITLQVGLDSQFADNPDVFVAGDLLWYPVEGRPDICAAPDVLVAFGRPKGHRGSYKQWAEGRVAPQVVFEILSPSNTLREMNQKRWFYERYGVQEYYEYDPDNGKLSLWERTGEVLQPVEFNGVWRSPRLGITLKLDADGELLAYHPDGRLFLRPMELDRLAQAAQARAEQEKARAEQEKARAELFANKLRELGIDPASLGD